MARPRDGPLQTRQSLTCALFVVIALAFAVHGQARHSRRDDEFQGYSHLPYPEDKIAYMQVVMPPMRAGIVSGFLVEIRGLVEDVGYILDIEWSQVCYLAHMCMLVCALPIVPCFSRRVYAHIRSHASNICWCHLTTCTHKTCRMPK